MVLGLLFAIGVVSFIVVGTIRDAGKQTLSSAIQKILLNYLQGEFVRWLVLMIFSFVRSRVFVFVARYKVRLSVETRPAHPNSTFTLVPVLLSRGARPGVSSSLAPSA
jgi:hypothetical protein